MLVTGASGFLGRRLLPLLVKKGWTVYALYHQKEVQCDGVIPIKGDINAPNLGLDKIPQFDRCYHLASLLSFDERKRNELFKVNLYGTSNVVSFCKRNNIHLFHISTAYICGDYKGVFTERDAYVGQKPKNSYEESKYLAESLVRYSQIRKTIFRPGVLISLEADLNASGFYQVVRGIAKIYIPLERLRLIVEGKLKLPPIRPIFRIEGEKEATINLVPVDWAAKKIAEIEEEGIFHLTNPNPPKLEELSKWVGEVLHLDIRIEKDFQKSLPEELFHRYSAPYLKYLWGEAKFESSVNSDFPQIGEKFIKEAVLKDLSLLI